MTAIAIVDTGMVSSIGFDSPSNCAAIRSGISGAEETRFLFDGQRLLGCTVSFEEHWAGRERILQMLAHSVRECLRNTSHVQTAHLPLVLCLAEGDRPGRLPHLDHSLVDDLAERFGLPFHHSSTTISNGRISGVQALRATQEHLDRGHPYCVIAGVDSYLVRETLETLHEERRLLTEENSDGFIPGEAAAAILVTPANAESDLVCVGIGFGDEPAPLGSGQPLRADGFLTAIRSAFEDCGLGYQDVDFRISDVSGEQYRFKEIALAELRSMRVRKEALELWHPSDCVGEIGAAITPVVLAVLRRAMAKGYAPGAGALGLFANDDSQRAAIIVRGLLRNAH